MTARDVQLPPRTDDHSLPMEHVGRAGGLEGRLEELLGLVEPAGGDEGLAPGGRRPHRMDGLVAALEELFDLTGLLEGGAVVAQELGDAGPYTAAIELAGFKAEGVGPLDGRVGERDGLFDSTLLGDDQGPPAGKKDGQTLIAQAVGDPPVVPLRQLRAARG